MAEQQEKINWADIEEDDEEHQQELPKADIVDVVEPADKLVDDQQETKPQTDKQAKPYKKGGYQKHQKPEWLRIKEMREKQEEQIKIQQEAALEARRLKPSRNVYKGLEINSDSEEEEEKPKEVEGEQKEEIKPEVAVVETIQQEDQYKLLKQKQKQQPEQQQQLSKKEQMKKEQDEFDQTLKEMGFMTNEQEKQQGEQEGQKKKNKKKKEKKEQPIQQIVVEEKQNVPVEKVDIKKVIAEKAKKNQQHQNTNVDKDLQNVKQEIEKRNNKSKKNKKHEDL